MRASHTAGAVSATFDDPNLVSCAGLVPVLRLAQRAGLHQAADQRVTLPDSAGSAAANPAAKITSIVAGMAAGGDSIDDLYLIRHGALPRLFTGIRAPSTVGTFLRGFTWGNVRQLDAVARRTLIGLARQAPLLPGAQTYAFLDVDSTVDRVYGYLKQGADYGYTRVRGLHPLLATVSTPLAAPVIVGTRLRRGSAGSAKGAASFVAEAITSARAAGATGALVARMDSAFYSHGVVAACIRADVRFSITVRQDRSIRRAIAAISSDAWTPIRYPNAIYDEDTGNGSRMPRSPRSATPRSPRAASPSGSSSGWSYGGSRTATSPNAKASCSPPGATTRSSPTPPWNWSRSRNTTANTRSSSRSTPMSKTQPWHTCRPGRSPRTPPG